MSRKRKRKSQQQRRLEALQAESHRIATTWWTDRIDLNFLGVDLGRCLEYQMLEAINSITKQEMASEAAPAAD